MKSTMKSFLQESNSYANIAPIKIFAMITYTKDKILIWHLIKLKNYFYHENKSIIMKILVIGAGGVGIGLATSVASQGAQVSIFAREKQQRQ